MNKNKKYFNKVYKNITNFDIKI